jgi:hypothetical protein
MGKGERVVRILSVLQRVKELSASLTTLSAALVLVCSLQQYCRIGMGERQKAISGDPSLFSTIQFWQKLSQCIQERI